MSTLAQPETAEEERAAELFADARDKVCRQTDRLFGALMILQWLAGIAAALVISPMTWIGTTSQTHAHVWAAIFLGGAISWFPVFLVWKHSGRVLTRHTIAVAQMLFSALLIHLTGGRIETHFHIFGSLAFLAIYRDWKVLVTATVVVTIDHAARGMFWPQSVFGISSAANWRWLEHAGWVLFEDAFLIASIRFSLRDMREVARRRANLEATNSRIEHQVEQRTAELVAAHQQLLGSERRFSSAFEHASIGMALVSADGRWLKVNPALCDLTGYTAVELCRMTVRDIVHPGDFETHRGEIRRIMAGEVAFYQREKRYLHKDGRVVWVLLNASLVRDNQGEPVHFVAQIQDITGRKQSDARLEAMNKDLLEASRRAGMAEVATSVLHNVGNVLNSVNVSCSIAADRVSRSSAGSVAKTADLLEEHAGDLAAFFTTDPRGRKLPEFLGKLARRLADEREEVLQELRSLGGNIDHIKEIVAMQQNYARVSGVREEVSLTDLVEDSLRMNGDGLERHDVEVFREYVEVPKITVEKHKVLQVLVNLIRNAKHACDDSGRAEKKMTVRVSGNGEFVRVAIRDNGVGILPENLARVFAHGFTTRAKGHGFGLHSGAIAAREMGGSLTVHSAGPGAGATFTLELPVSPPADLQTLS